MAGGPVAASGPAGTCCPQVQDVVKCQMGVCRADESEDSPDSCKNGQLQILVSEEARAGHRWVLSAPCPRPLTCLICGGEGTETGFDSGPATDSWVALGKSCPPSVFPLSGAAGGDHAWGPSALWGSVPSRGRPSGRVGRGLRPPHHPDTWILSLPVCSLPLCL